MVVVTLKPKHSLVGRSLLPVIIELKSVTDTATGGDGQGQLARLKKDHPLEHYSVEELMAEFRKLTGDSLTDVLALAGKTSDPENVRFAVHLAVVHANAAGAPRGQTLAEAGRQTAEQGQSACPSPNGAVQIAPSTSGNGMFLFINIKILSY